MAKKKYRKTREYLDIAAKIVTGQRQYDYGDKYQNCLLYTSPSPRDVEESRMPSSA